MRSFIRTLVTVAIALALAGAAAAQTTPYELSPTTKLVWGCLGPCACPVIWTGAVEGGFGLVHLGDSQRFSYFTVRDVAWSYRVPGTERVAHVTGDGVYQFGFGAEDSVVQRMQLELVTDGSLAQHFDSGFVPFHWENPKIDIDLHVDASRCADSLLHLVATPSSASTGTRPPVIRIATAPNPTRADVEIVVALPAPDHVMVDVLDLHGRSLVTLADRPLFEPETRLRWDGRTRTGADAGVGVFWIRVHTGSRSVASRIVRLR